MILVFNNAQSLREACNGGYKTEAALQAVVVAAMAAVVATGQLFTCAAACSGYSQQDIQNVVRDLVGSGFGCSFSGTTLTITW